MVCACTLIESVPFQRYCKLTVLSTHHRHDCGCTVQLFPLGKFFKQLCDVFYTLLLFPILLYIIFAGAIGYSNAHFGRGSGPIFIKSINCSGSELSLLDCPRDTYTQHTFTHAEDASVHCEGIASSFYYLLVV